MGSLTVAWEKSMAWGQINSPTLFLARFAILSQGPPCRSGVEQEQREFDSLEGSHSGQQAILDVLIFCFFLPIITVCQTDGVLFLLYTCQPAPPSPVPERRYCSDRPLKTAPPGDSLQDPFNEKRGYSAWSIPSGKEVCSLFFSIR